MRVEHHHGVVVEDLEDLAAQPLQAGHQADLLALVQLEAFGVGEHDRRDMSEEPGSGHFTH